MTETNSTPPLHLARRAGVLYLVIILCGVLGEALFRAPFMDPEHLDTMRANLVAQSFQFRIGIMMDVVMALSDVALGVLLYFIFESVDRMESLAAMVFRLVQASILGLNLMHLVQGLELASAPIESNTQLHLMLISLQGHGAGYDLGLFFFGINCLLVARLGWKAAFVPNAIALMMGASGGVYLLGSTIRVVTPELADTFAAAYLVPLIAELAFCGYLLFRLPGWKDRSLQSS